MDRIYEANAAPALPVTPTYALGFPQGDAAQPNVTPTSPGPGWFNWVTESVRNVIVAAGIMPNGQDRTQLIQAIDALALLASLSASPGFTVALEGAPGPGPVSGTHPLTINFADTSTPAPTAWHWDFGDGNTSALQNPSHTYTSAGTYSVTLTATIHGIPAPFTRTAVVVAS